MVTIALPEVTANSDNTGLRTDGSGGVYATHTMWGEIPAALDSLATPSIRLQFAIRGQGLDLAVIRQLTLWPCVTGTQTNQNGLGSADLRTYTPAIDYDPNASIIRFEADLDLTTSLGPIEVRRFRFIILVSDKVMPTQNEAA